jgi:hypothetical protein
MKAFHNKQEIKDRYINRLKEHAKQDEIIKGNYWEHGKGCAVGCTIHSGDHKAYEIELGIPTILAKLEDRLFESLPNAEAKKFPLQFLNAIPVGADLSTIWPKFAIFLLTDKSQCNSRHEMCDIVANAFRDELEGKEVNWDEIRSKAADAAADAAFDAAYAAAAADAARVAARDASRAASRAADAAVDNVADDVVYVSYAAYDAAVEAAYAASAYKTSIYNKIRTKQVNYLLKLLKEAK